MIGARYQKVYCRIWTGPEFRSWTDDARVLGLYLLTCPHRTTEGLFRLPLAFAHYELGWTPERTATALQELQGSGFVEHDPAADLVWLVLALEWDGPVGANQIKGAVRALAEVGESPLRRRYLERAKVDCPELAEAIEADLEWQNDPEPPPPDPLQTPPEPPPKGLPPVDSTPSEPQALTHHPSHHPSPSHAPATHDPRSTQEGPSTGRGGRGGDSPASIIATADVELGLANPPVPTAGELRTVTDALARGWTPHDLTALATTAAHRTDIDRPRAWVHGAWARLANTGPEHAADVIDLAGRRPGPGPLPRHHPADCPGHCSDEGWIDLPDGGVAKCTGQPREVTG